MRSCDGPGSERQRPAWSSLERWLPVQTTLRLTPVPRVGLAAGRPRPRRSRSARPPSWSGRDQPAAPVAVRARPATGRSCTARPTATSTRSIPRRPAPRPRSSAGHRRPIAPGLSPDGTRMLVLRDADAIRAARRLQPMSWSRTPTASNVRPLTGADRELSTGRGRRDSDRLALVGTTSPSHRTSMDRHSDLDGRRSLVQPVARRGHRADP